jgi:ArsR family transcriptional regulator, arsenate/arsenite/antimonite-responsive transcriptional repressor / arsenate reductase (thioredoxin)
MNSERTSALARRVATYAALADPTRLQIIDLLSVSDLSASEVGATLHVPSNLLAHHLNVLTDAGLINRRRSEGDRRRRYLTLNRNHKETGSPHIAAPGRAPRITTPQRVLFVCTANTARSHLAAALWRHTSDIAAASAGTHPGSDIHPKARAAAERHGITLPHVKPRALDHQRRSGDLLITVCDRAHEELGDQGWAHWSIPDPVTKGTDRAFDAAFEQLAARVHAIAPQFARAS